MDGAYFYWMAWIAWVISTFFMKKNKFRFTFSLFILSLICLSAHTLTIYDLKINIGLLFLLAYSYFGISKHKSLLKLIYFYISSLAITLGYVSFHLFELYDPVWLFLDRKWLLTIGLTFIIIFLFKNTKDRIICLILSSCQGELLYAVILQKFAIQFEIGSLAYLDILSISFVLMQGWHLLERAVYYFDINMQKQVKEKQG